MNPTLQTELAGLLELLRKSLEAGADMALVQLPLIVQEYLRWQAAQTGMALGVGVLSVFVTYKLAKWAKRLGLQYEKVGKSDASFDHYVLYVLFSAMGVGALGSIVINLFHLVKLYTAPRIVVLEWIKGML